MQLIPKSVFAWYDINNKLKNYPNIKVDGFSGMSYRFWMFCDLYDVYLKEFEHELKREREVKRRG